MNTKRKKVTFLEESIFHALAGDIVGVTFRELIKYKKRCSRKIVRKALKKLLKLKFVEKYGRYFRQSITGKSTFYNQYQS